MGVYYLSAVTPPPENEKHLEKAVRLSKKASDGERRFIEAMVVARANQGAGFRTRSPRSRSWPRTTPASGWCRSSWARSTRERTSPTRRAPPSAGRTRSARRARGCARSSRTTTSWRGEYEKARRTFLDVEKSLPKGSAPFAVRYGLAFSHLYEGQVDPASRGAPDLPGRVPGLRGGAGLPRGLHLELDRPHQPRERPARRGHEGVREGLRERARQQPARGPEAGVAGPSPARAAAASSRRWGSTRRPGRRRRRSRR